VCRKVDRDQEWPSGSRPGRSRDAGGGRKNPRRQKDRPACRKLTKEHKTTGAVPQCAVPAHRPDSVEHRAGTTSNIQPASVLADVGLEAGRRAPRSPSRYTPARTSQFGPGLQLALFLTSAGRQLTWAVGPIFQFPSASTTELGTAVGRRGHRSARVHERTVVSTASWPVTLVVRRDTSASAVNLTSLEVLVSYNFPGLYIQFDSTNSYTGRPTLATRGRCRSASTWARCRLGARPSACSSAPTRTSNARRHPEWIVRAQIPVPVRGGQVARV